MKFQRLWMFLSSFPIQEWTLPYIFARLNSRLPRRIVVGGENMLKPSSCSGLNIGDPIQSESLRSNHTKTWLCLSLLYVTTTNWRPVQGVYCHFRHLSSMETIRDLRLKITCEASHDFYYGCRAQHNLLQRWCRQLLNWHPNYACLVRRAVINPVKP